MTNGRVEMAVREVKRQCRTLRISAAQQKSVRIGDGSPLLSVVPRFAAQVMNKMRIGEDGNTREVRQTHWTNIEETTWHDSERKFGSVKLEKMVSQYMCMPYDSFLYHLKWSGARHKFDVTTIERRMRCNELGWSVWHSVANGGSCV